MTWSGDVAGNVTTRGRLPTSAAVLKGCRATEGVTVFDASMEFRRSIYKSSNHSRDLIMERVNLALFSMDISFKINSTLRRLTVIWRVQCRAVALQKIRR